MTNLSIRHAKFRIVVLHRRSLPKQHRTEKRSEEAESRPWSVGRRRRASTEAKGAGILGPHQNRQYSGTKKSTTTSHQIAMGNSNFM
jgi:hypothetical protein